MVLKRLIGSPDEQKLVDVFASIYVDRNKPDVKHRCINLGSKTNQGWRYSIAIDDNIAQEGKWSLTGNFGLLPVINKKKQQIIDSMGNKIFYLTEGFEDGTGLILLDLPVVEGVVARYGTTGDVELLGMGITIVPYHDDVLKKNAPVFIIRKGGVVTVKMDNGKTINISMDKSEMILDKG